MQAIDNNCSKNSTLVIVYKTGRRLSGGMFVKGVLMESSCDSMLIFIIFLALDTEKVKQIKSWKENWQDSVNCLCIPWVCFVYLHFLIWSHTLYAARERFLAWLRRWTKYSFLPSNFENSYLYIWVLDWSSWFVRISCY